MLENLISNWYRSSDQVILAIWATIDMVAISGVISFVLGISFGVTLVVTNKGGILENMFIYNFFDKMINAIRSIPFLILMILLIPISRMIVGTGFGVAGAIIPLIFGTTPFFSRQIETAISELDSGLIEASLAMGLSPFEIIFSVYLRESISSIARVTQITAINLVALATFAGAIIGAGGLGDIAFRLGHQNNNPDLLWVSIAIIMVFVSLIQWIGNLVIKRKFTIRKTIAFLVLVGLGLTLARSVTTIETSEEFAVVSVGVVGAFQDQWLAVNEELYDERIRVELVYFGEWTLPNSALNDGITDLNAFQTIVFLNRAMDENGYDLAVVGSTFVSPMNIFSERLNIPANPERTSLLPYLEDGAIVGLPSDPINIGRSLRMLEAAGLIDLDPIADFLVTNLDIVNFHVKLEFLFIDANLLPQSLEDVDMAVINAPQALTHGLSARESIFREDTLNIEIADGLVNLIVSRAGEEDNPVFLRILNAYQTQAVKDVFENNFEGAFLPAW